MMIRSIRLSDYAAVSALLEQTLSEECYTDTMEALARQLSWDSDVVLVAENLHAFERQIVGIIIGTIDNHKGYYYRIAVARNFQGKGIAKKLIKGLRGRFTERKVQKIMVNVDAHNKPIVPLYQSLGYEENDFTETRLQIVSDQ